MNPSLENLEVRKRLFFFEVRFRGALALFILFLGNFRCHSERSEESDGVHTLVLILLQCG